MFLDAPTDGRDGPNPVDNQRGESKRERVEETGGGTVLQQYCWGGDRDVKEEEDEEGAKQNAE